jgi:predicted transcriptional regulator
MPAVPASEARSIAGTAARALLVLEPFHNLVRCQLLLYVYRFPGLSLRDLAAFVQCDPSTATIYMKMLAGSGWVRMERAGRQKLAFPASLDHERFLKAIELVVDCAPEVARGCAIDKATTD